VAAAGLGPVRSVEPLGGGHSNTVWSVTLSDGERIVARSAGVERMPRYEMERLVMARAYAAGVPCPEVLGVVAIDDTAVMLESFVDGSPLRSVASPARFATACGVVLATIHGIAVDGFGNLDAAGRGGWPTFASWFVGAATDDALAGTDVPPVGEPVLVHGDFSPANVLVRGEEIVAVVDWESAKAGPPALDLAWWDWWVATLGGGAPFSGDAMFDGYESIRPVDRALLDALRPLVVRRIEASVRR
jgi:aminoglycoside phosphotransferase (APT) family kinase protein